MPAAAQILELLPARVVKLGPDSWTDPAWPDAADGLHLLPAAPAEHAEPRLDDGERLRAVPLFRADLKGREDFVECWHARGPVIDSRDFTVHGWIAVLRSCPDPNFGSTVENIAGFLACGG